MAAFERCAAALALVLAAAPAPAGEKAARTEVKGRADFLKSGVLIVDGQRVRLTAQTKVQGVARGTDIPLGSEVKAAGSLRPDGSIEATRVEVRANRVDGNEVKLIAACDDIEAKYRQAGQALSDGGNGKLVSLGKISQEGPAYTRTRGILDRLLPPSVGGDEVRLYVVENKEWNAFAMANYALYVHTGLLADMDDDEVAIVVGHELAHATLEHSRRTMSKGKWASIAGTVASIGGDMLGGWGGAAMSGIGGLGSTALNSKFSRGFEDEADRVGLRYAYEGGFDASKAPALWARFARKYGDGGGVGNALFGSHSAAGARARNMEGEVARNYAAGAGDEPTRPRPEAAAATEPAVEPPPVEQDR